MKRRHKTTRNPEVPERVRLNNWHVIGVLYLQLRVLLIGRGRDDAGEILRDGRTRSDLLTEALEWVAAHDTLPDDYRARDYTIRAVRRKYNALLKGADLRETLHREIRDAEDIPAATEEERGEE